MEWLKHREMLRTSNNRNSRNDLQDDATQTLQRKKPLQIYISSLLDVKCRCPKDLCLLVKACKFFFFFLSLLRGVNMEITAKGQTEAKLNRSTAADSLEIPIPVIEGGVCRTAYQTKAQLMVLMLLMLN